MNKSTEVATRTFYGHPPLLSSYPEAGLVKMMISFRILKIQSVKCKYELKFGQKGKKFGILEY